MSNLIRRVFERFLQAGAVMPFKPKAGVPTIPIAGRKYVLSTDGGPLGDREYDPPPGIERGEGGARVITGPQGTKWKYLWAYDIDKQFLAMWRVSDGNEKMGGSARNEQGRIVRLEKKGQLNRVTHEEFRQVEAEMRQREADTIRELQKVVEESKDDAIQAVDKYTREFFSKNVESKLQRALADIDRGVVPIGFKPFGPGEDDPAWKRRQMFSHVLRKVFEREMPLAKVEGYLTSKGVNVEEAGQWVEWAIGDVRDAAIEKYLPPRP
jgi:hypothetical protein